MVCVEESSSLPRIECPVAMELPRIEEPNSLDLLRIEGPKALVSYGYFNTSGSRALASSVLVFLIKLDLVLNLEKDLS